KESARREAKFTSPWVLPALTRSSGSHVAELLLPATNLTRKSSCAGHCRRNTLPGTTIGSWLGSPGQIANQRVRCKPDRHSERPTLPPPRAAHTPKGPVQMRKGILALAAAGLVVAGGLAACGNSSTPSSGSSGSAKAPFVGVILPDTKSSVRWE